MLSKRDRYSWLFDTLFLMLVFGILFFTLLGSRPLFVPDEGRYAEIAREMAALGDYITPYLNGIKYFEKPVLFYWLGALAIKLGGLNLWSIRSINACLGLIGCLLTYFTARSLYNRETGLLAAFILGTSTLYFVMSHMICLDLPVTFFLLVSLYSFLLGVCAPFGRKRMYYLIAASAAAGLAVLTKGLIGIVFPIMIIGIWMLLLNELSLLKRIYLPACLFIFIAITLPWHIFVGSRNPEFFYFYFIEQHFLRYTSDDIGHYQPIWFFIPVLLLGFFPWFFFLPQAIYQQCRTWKVRYQHKNDWFFAIWALFIFAFFSFSKSKLIPYILPIFPPLAILTARYLVSVVTPHSLRGIPAKAGASLRLKIPYTLLLLASCFIAYEFHQFPIKTLLPDPAAAASYLNICAAILVSGALVGCVYAYRSKFKMALMITIAASASFLLFSLAAIPALDSRTILPLANLLNPILQPNDEVVAFNQYYQDLPFYLKRRVTILNWRNELNLGMRHQDTSEWMINDPIFWQRWNSQKRLFVIMGNSEYKQLKRKYPEKYFYVLGKTPNNVLLSNQNVEQKLHQPNFLFKETH